MSGAYVVVEIAYMFGQTRQLLNSRTALMVGSASSLTVNWQQCTRVAVPKMAVIAQVMHLKVKC